MMKKTAVIFAFFSVILCSCSQFKEVSAKAAPAAPPPPPPPIQAALPIPPEPKVNLENFVSKNDFIQFKQQLIPAPDIKKMFQSQQEKMQELSGSLAALQKNAVEKPELVKSQQMMIPRPQFEEYAAGQQRLINELKRENMALREISKDMTANASKIAELRCEEIWHKTIIVMASFMISVLALLGAVFIKLSRRLNNLK